LVKSVLFPFARHLQLPVKVSIIDPPPAKSVTKANVQTNKSDLSDRHEGRDGIYVYVT
jgi:hypothetical protein